LREHAHRQDYFETTFHFECTCSRCSLDGRTVEQADARTRDIIALQWALGQWTSNSTATVKKAERLVQLYKEEGLDAFLDEPYGHAALTYNAVGDAQGASKYAKLAAEGTWLKYGWEKGWGLEKVREWEEMGRNPEGHSSWRKRRPEKEEL
jgi:hypothetical protein